jgi:hypothetical protein
VEVIDRLLDAALADLAGGTLHWTSRRDNTKTKVSLNTRIINLYSSLGWALLHLAQWERAEQACINWNTTNEFKIKWLTFPRIFFTRGNAELLHHMCI